MKTLWGMTLYAVGFSFALTSCGYRLSEEKDSASCKMAISYVRGDIDGRLTDAIINTMSTSSKWQYVQDQADVVLDIEVVQNDRYHIGYKYDRVASTAQLINRLIPSEGRRTVRLRLQLLDATRGQVLHGPYEVEAFADYDFVNFDTYKDLAFVNQAGVAESVLSFSLGQLDSEEGGKCAVEDAVYHHLAEKIVVGLDHL